LTGKRLTKKVLTDADYGGTKEAFQGRLYCISPFVSWPVNSFLQSFTVSSAASTAVGKDEDFIVFVNDVKAAKDWKTST
jgi:hypothetical protein